MTLTERVRAVLSSFYLADYDLAVAEGDASAATAAMKGFADLHALRFQPPPDPEAEAIRIRTGVPRYKVDVTYE